jgi:hypothetical protein
MCWPCFAGNTRSYDGCAMLLSWISAYTEIICPYTMCHARYKKSSLDALVPPSGSYSPSISLGTGISAHCWCRAVEWPWPNSIILLLLLCRTVWCQSLSLRFCPTVTTTWELPRKSQNRWEIYKTFSWSNLLSGNVLSFFILNILLFNCKLTKQHILQTLI